MKSFLKLFATFFEIGKFPKAPGTVGTLATIPLFMAMSGLSDLTYMTLVIVIVILGIFAAQAYQSDILEHDRQEIVIDEVAGYLITMTLVPCNWKTILAGFILFRFLDILKPWPISYLDKNVKGGAGVMVDDVAAGIIANVVLQLTLNYAPRILSVG